MSEIMDSLEKAKVESYLKVLVMRMGRMSNDMKAIVNFLEQVGA
jgi:hypothetical protein